MLHTYRESIEQADFSAGLPETLKMSESGRFTTVYAPFEHVNQYAKVVLCGITPGQSQALIALRDAQSGFRRGRSVADILASAKGVASFAGQMRSNMTKMFDFVGLNHYLGLTSCQALFNPENPIAHFMSALRYPVLKDGKDFSGGIEIVRNRYLWEQCQRTLAEDIAQLPDDAVYIPFGQSVDEAFKRMIQGGLLRQHQVLLGFPHPSGLNSERIAYFCQEKPREKLSRTTNADTWDARRSAVLNQLEFLGSVPRRSA